MRLKIIQVGYTLYNDIASFSGDSDNFNDCIRGIDDKVLMTVADID